MVSANIMMALLAIGVLAPALAAPVPPVRPGPFIKDKDKPKGKKYPGPKHSSERDDEPYNQGFDPKANNVPDPKNSNMVSNPADMNVPDDKNKNMIADPKAMNIPDPKNMNIVEPPKPTYPDNRYTTDVFNSGSPDAAIAPWKLLPGRDVQGRDVEHRLDPVDDDGHAGHIEVRWTVPGETPPSAPAPAAANDPPK